MNKMQKHVFTLKEDDYCEQSQEILILSILKVLCFLFNLKGVGYQAIHVTIRG
jgi:hypothetical protein